MAKRRRKRARHNPTAREYGALIITTAVVAGVSGIVTWYVTKFLSEREREEAERKRQGLLPGGEMPRFEEVPKGGGWV